MVESKNDPIDYLHIANKIFEGTYYSASDKDIEILATNISILEKKGLGKLNRRLIDGGRNIWDTFSEINFATVLISNHNEEIPISYEPSEHLQRPPDFRIEIGNLTYWIQMKKLSNLERENRQTKYIQRIKTEVEKVNIGIFYCLKLSPQFSEGEIPDLVVFITKHAESYTKGEKYFFPNNMNPKAVIDFFPPNKLELSSLTLGTSGDVDMVNETGLAESQIKQSLINASGAFKWDVDQDTINLVVLDADNQRDINISEAVFGTEYEMFCDGKHAWSRKNNGFFNLSAYSEKVAAVIAIRSKERKPITKIFLMLYINDRFKDRLHALNKLLSFDKIISFNMRTPMGKSNFKL
jgi:hypothetical protein